MKLLPGLFKNIFNLLLNPQGWRDTLAEIGVAEDFNLFQVSWASLRENPGLRKLLLQTYLVIPLLAGVISILLVAARGKTAIPVLLFSFTLAASYSFANAFATSLLINFGTAQVYGLAIGLGMGFLGDNPANIYFSYAVAAGLAGQVLLNFAQPEKKGGFLKNNLFSFISGFIAVLILIFAWGVVFSGQVVRGRLIHFVDTGLSLKEYFLLLSTAVFVMSLVAFLAVYIRNLNAPKPGAKSIFWAFLLGGTVGASTITLITGNPMTALGACLAGLGGGITFSIFLSLPWILFYRTKLDSAMVVASTFMAGAGWTLIGGYLVPGFVLDVKKHVFSMLIISLGLVFKYWFPIISYPFLTGFNEFLFWLDSRDPTKQFKAFNYHPVFWFSGARIPWVGLDRYLVRIHEVSSERAHQAMLRVSKTSQRWAVRNALLSIAYKKLVSCETLTDIISYEPPVVEIPDETIAFKNHFNRLAGEIRVALAYQSPYHTRVALVRVQEELVNLEKSLMMVRNRRIYRFMAVSAQWQGIIKNTLQALSSQSRDDDEIPNPYVCGIPLNDKQEIFVGRSEVFERIEQLVLDEQRPPILLYGQRRMGKTSLLLNLSKILPSSIIPMYMDCQVLGGVGSYNELFYGMARQLSAAAERSRNLVLPKIDLVALKDAPLIGILEWLLELDIFLEKEAKTAFFMIDEFETMTHWAIKRNEDINEIFNLHRHIVQHHPRIKVMFSGAHHLSEMEDWVSGLINMQVIKLDCLKREEAAALVQSPIRDFRLQYTPGAVDWILDLTGGHPHLLQSFCYELVILKNEQSSEKRMLVEQCDLDETLERATLSGEFFFMDIYQNQINPAMKKPLVILARAQSGLTLQAWAQEAGIDLNAAIRLAFKRELIWKNEGGFYQFTIEWIRWWFAKQEI